MNMRMAALAIVAAVSAAVLAGPAKAAVVLNPGAVEEGWPAATGPNCPAGTSWHETLYYQKDGSVRPAGCYPG
jgi:hypothetical protein